MTKAKTSKSPLLFIDNDYECPAAQEGIDAAHSRLSIYGKLPEQWINDMEIIRQFHLVKKDDAYKMLYESKKVIVTYSMYTTSHLNSKGQLTHFLRIAGISQIKNIVYLDASGQIKEYLERDLPRIEKEVFPVLQAIATNKILTVDYDNGCFSQVILDFKGMYKPPFILKPVKKLKELILK